MIDVSYQERLEVLKTYQLVPRLTRVLELIKRQLQVFSISQKLSQSVENKLSKKQREIILREQLEAIKKELGETEEDDEGELADISKKVKVLELPSDEHKKVSCGDILLQTFYI
jgi:ATP-dependent Lon protease